MIFLCEATTITVGSISILRDTNTEVSTEAKEKRKEIKLDDKHLRQLLELCKIPRTRMKMQSYCKIKTEKYFRKNILQPMLVAGLLQRMMPNKPNSSKQQYRKI